MSGRETRFLWVALILVCAGTAAAVICALRGLYRVRRRRRAMERPFPAEWDELLRRSVPVYERLPEDLRFSLRRRINVFLDEMRFVGCAGLEISDEVRLVIAAQACLLRVGQADSHYSGFRSILVYPDTYVDPATRRDAPVVEAEARRGESWKRGPLVLSWRDALHGAGRPRDGHNVVFHEFAHKLDEEDGDIDGTPALGGRVSCAAWAEVLGEEYRRLRARVARGKRSALDSYGAAAPEEFFAVATEAFFEKPRKLKRRHPELYEELAGFFEVDPGEWGR